MKSFVEKYAEYLKTDSNMSAMRLAFFWVVRVALFIAVISVIFAFVSGMLNKNFDLAACAALVGLLLGVAFTGKTGQSFAEKNTPSSNQ